MSKSWKYHNSALSEEAGQSSQMYPEARTKKERENIYILCARKEKVATEVAQISYGG